MEKPILVGRAAVASWRRGVSLRRANDRYRSSEHRV